MEVGCGGGTGEGAARKEGQGRAGWEEVRRRKGEIASREGLGNQNSRQTGCVYVSAVVKPGRRVEAGKAFVGEEGQWRWMPLGRCGRDEQRWQQWLEGGRATYTGRSDQSFWWICRKGAQMQKLYMQATDRALVKSSW